MLRAMPKLKSASIDFGQHKGELLTLMEMNPGLVPDLPYRVDTERGRSWWALEGEAVEGLKVSGVMGGRRDGCSGLWS